MTQRAEALYKAFQAAVIRQFGRNHAGDKRYASKEHNPETRAAAQAFHVAVDAFLDAKAETEVSA